MKEKPHPLDIPEFLKISAEDRKKAWEEFPPDQIRSSFKMEEPKYDPVIAMRKLMDEYNALGNKLLELGGTFRPVSSFRVEHDAEMAIEKLKSTIKAREKANAEMEKQSDDDNGVIVEIVKENEMSTTAKGTKKKAAPAKKAAAKKVAPAAKKVAKKNGGTGKFAPDAKITIIAKENPRRPGSEKFKDFERAQKSATVGEYVKHGGNLGPLRHAISKGWLKVS